MKIYISLPISRKDINKQKRLAGLTAERLRLQGHFPVNPFDVHAPDGMSEREQYAYYMGEDVKTLMTCDAILMLDRRWGKSKGCSIEQFIADKMCMEIFYDENDIPGNGD